jgi:mevalonate kinase
MCRIPTLRFLLTDTNHPRRTAILVAHVANLLTTLPGVTGHILTAIDGIAAEAKRLLESDENITERLGELISINQGLLNSVGVGHEKLDSVARITKEVGWTKLTGAGGGGCALTLLREGTILLNVVNCRCGGGQGQGC